MKVVLVYGNVHVGIAPGTVGGSVYLLRTNELARIWCWDGYWSKYSMSKTQQYAMWLMTGIPSLVHHATARGVTLSSSFEYCVKFRTLTQLRPCMVKPLSSSCPKREAW